MTNVIAFSPEHFWSKRTTKEVYAKKQELVQLLCFYYEAAIQRKAQFGTAEFEISLLSLRSIVRDYQPAFNFFFDVVKKGYRFSADRKELTVVVPKILDIDIQSQYKFIPPTRPNQGVMSKVCILDDPLLMRDVIQAGLLHLIPKIEFLQKGPGEVNFIFEPSGELGLRDTSIWPISAIETWPSWIRTRLFGRGVDIKSAYVQFVVEEINKKYEVKSQFLFDKILKLWNEPHSFRSGIANILGVDVELHKKNIKRLIMSVAMGSKVSSTLVFNDISFSRCSGLINKIQPNLTEEQAKKICEYIMPLYNQFKLAKKTLKIDMGQYFKWERKRRYLIWELAERQGIMMHDGIDGIPDDVIEQICSMDLGFEISKS